MVASPSVNFYKDLVTGILERQGGKNTGHKRAFSALAKVVAAVWNQDQLRENPATTVCNESSTVLYGELTDKSYKILLVGDAGIEALSRAYNHIRLFHGFETGSLTFMQMPLHGSRNNVNVNVLDNLLGQKISQYSDSRGGVSYASVAKKATDQPKKSVLNAFITRGYNSYYTGERNLWHCAGNMPCRYDYFPVTPETYSPQVEAIED